MNVRNLLSVMWLCGFVVMWWFLGLSQGVVCAASAIGGDIRNDVFWNTADGKPLYSQGGGIFRFQDKDSGEMRYYWYGNHYREAETYRHDWSKTPSGNTIVGVSCYSSTDLTHWRDEGLVMDAKEISGGRGWAGWFGRLGVAYIEETRQYALFAQHNSSVMVALADDPTGPFKVHKHIDMKPLIGTPNTGDQTVFTDEDTGRDYLIYSYGKGRHIGYVSEIGVMDDGTIGLKNCVTVYKGEGREGNCMFKYKGKYYLCASNLYGWDSSYAYYLVSDSIYGPYTPTNKMQVMKGCEKDYAHVTQTGFFYTVRGSEQETVIYCGDRWSDFAGNGLGYNQWVPLSFDGDTPIFNSISHWCLDVRTGRWSVGEENNYILNGSFEADRRSIPNQVKPRQEFLLGWETKVIKGNKVSLDNPHSPFLNYINKEEDRKFVIGEKSLCINDSVEFEREVLQVIESTPYVPLMDGEYILSFKVKENGLFRNLLVTVDSKAGKQSERLDVRDEGGSSYGWTKVKFPVKISGGKASVVFYAKGKPLAMCLIDDVELKRRNSAHAVAEDICKGWKFECQGKTYTVDLPHTWNVMDGYEDYYGKASYSKVLQIRKEDKGRSIRLKFNAVYHDAYVYVNNRLVGSHLNAGYTPFSFEISDFLDFESPESNVLRVEVDNSFSKSNLPYDKAFDWNNDGGIIRGVELTVSDRPTIRYAHFTPSLNLQDSVGTVGVNVRLWEDDVDKADFFLQITGKAGKVVYEGVKRMKRNANGEFSWTVDCGKVVPWHFDNPYLYRYSVRVQGVKSSMGSKVPSTVSGHIGFRQFSIQGNRFVLNGEEVRLPGIESMQGSHPQYGMAEPGSILKQTVYLMKQLNCVITRFHWMQDDKLLDLMDSMGILVQEELPWWQKPYGSLTEELRETAHRQIDEMIEAHYNHPCIVAWALSNEVGDNQEEVKQLAQHTRTLDATRIVDVSCNFINRNLQNDPSLMLDLPTWNEYVGTWNGKDREELPVHLENIGNILNGRPLFITEHGLCEPVFSGGDKQRIDDMLYHTKYWQQTPYICGYIYFCLQDYRTQMGEEGLGRYRIRRHGVTDCMFNPKASFYVLRGIASPVEILSVKMSTAKENEGSLAQAWTSEGGDRNIIVELQVKNTIPSYVLRGYFVRYDDSSGYKVEQYLNDMIPGRTYTVVLEDINPRFHFEVCRPNGYSVISY